MKYSVVVIFFLLFSGLDMQSQCYSESGDFQCIEKITGANKFVKSYKLDAHRTGDIEYSTVLVKDLRYYLNLCEEGEVTNNVEINVYDTKRKLVTSNKDGDRSTLPELSFTCPRTGIYYFVFKKGQAAANCGIGALSFSK